MIESETSSTSIKLATSDADDDTHGCHIDGEYYQDGMQVCINDGYWSQEFSYKKW